jgi:hypothetical protein
MTRLPVVRFTASATEKQLMQAIIDAARTLGYLCYHTFDSRRSAPGFPDLVLCGRGRLLFIEVKGPRGRFRAGQQEWLQRLIDIGVEAYVVTPADYDALLADLQEWAA